MSDGSHALVGLGEKGAITFRIDLPGRGHAAAAHPSRPEAIAFARRPGTFAIILDCLSGRPVNLVEAPPNRHFCGHGTYSADGGLLFTTENDFSQSLGVVGVWDASKGYVRIGEMSSGGVGPHDMHLMADGQTLVVANGGIETHPDSGRTKLNLPTMRPNLSYMDPFGRIADQIELEPEYRRNSIRHLAIGPDSTVAFALQWQGNRSQRPPLLGIHRRGLTERLLAAPSDDHGRMQGYAGSVAVSGDRTKIAITSPRGGVLQIFDVAGGSYLGQLHRTDVCGICPSRTGFVFTTGTGLVVELNGLSEAWRVRHDCDWDNHLIHIA